VAWISDQTHRHGQVWQHYQAVLNADPIEHGRKARAEKACMQAFVLDRATVQRKIKAMTEVQDALRAFAKAAEDPMRKVAAAFDEVEGMRKSAVQSGLISQDAADQLLELDIPGAHEVLDMVLNVNRRK
jgi:hypothetical protein